MSLPYKEAEIKSVKEEIIGFDEKGEALEKSSYKRLFIPLVIILVASLSFGIGRLSVAGNREPIKIEYGPEASLPKQEASVSTVQTTQTASVVKAIPTSTSVVGSKNGTKYHYSHCSGAKQIKEENKIVFASPQAAESAGYTLALNCKPR